MADINIEIDPEKFEKFAIEIVNGFKKLEIEIKTYELVFQRLSQEANFPHLDSLLNLVRRDSEMRNALNQKYDAVLKDVRTFVHGSIPDEVFLKLMTLVPPADSKN